MFTVTDSRKYLTENEISKRLNNSKTATEVLHKESEISFNDNENDENGDKIQTYEISDFTIKVHKHFIKILITHCLRIFIMIQINYTVMCIMILGAKLINRHFLLFQNII